MSCIVAEPISFAKKKIAISSYPVSREYGTIKATRTMSSPKAHIDFLVVGTPRAATTWLYVCLQDHPQICLTEKKSYNPFDDTGNINEQDILEKFKHCNKPQALHGVMAYLLFREKESSLWVKKQFSQAKIIMILRNPIERAFSQYKHNAARGVLEQVSFSEAIRRPAITMEHGLYADAVASYWEQLGKQNVCILVHDDIIRDPAESLKRVQEFLGINPRISEHAHEFISVSRESRKSYHSVFLLHIHRSLRMMSVVLKKKFPWFKKITASLRLGKVLNLIAFANYNKQVDMGAEKSMEKVHIDPIDREYLREYYQTDINKLSKLLDRDLRWS